MPSNQQRRDAAKRKLQRQLVRRQERAAAQRRRLMIVGAVVAVLVIAGGVWLVTSLGSNDTAAGNGTSGTGTAGASQTVTSSTAVPSSTAPSTPCSYPASGTADKAAKAPTNLSPANKGTVDATVTLNSGKLTFALDRANAPCAVESFLSLASQKYFDNTPCHRLTTASTLKVLQCGSPKGTPSGGPGYSFADELTGNETYTAGTLAMANSGPNTNGSQFFIVYGDSQLNPAYTVLGTVTKGLDVVKKIAAKGVQGGGQDGAPAEKVTITSVTVPPASVTATGSYPTTSAPAASAGSASDAGSASSAGSASGASGAGSASGASSAGSASSASSAGSASGAQSEPSAGTN